MKPQHVFDRVRSSLGFSNAREFAAALGRTKQSASYWRNVGFPKRLHSDLQILAGQRRRPLPPEFYISTGIPDPSRSAAEADACADA
jgi:hypothetical protein